MEVFRIMKARVAVIVDFVAEPCSVVGTTASTTPTVERAAQLMGYVGYAADISFLHFPS